jgi:hypothetical protein
MLRERGGFSVHTDDASEAGADGPALSQDRVLTPDEIVDLNARDSFPASDPPSWGASTPGGPAHKLKPSPSH